MSSNLNDVDDRLLHAKNLVKFIYYFMKFTNEDVVHLKFSFKIFFLIT